MGLMATPESRAQRHIFTSERAASKLSGVPDDTPLRSVASVGVIGAGTMGGGIAMNFLNAGIPVVLLEMKQEALDKGLATIRRNYENSAKKGKLKAEQVEQRMGLITPTLTYDAFKGVDLVIEAVFENMDVKKQVFKTLDEVCKPGAMLATNTSYLNVDHIASVTKRPQDVIGLHFFSPANVMRLLEVVRGAQTAPDVWPRPCPASPRAWPPCAAPAPRPEHVAAAAVLALARRRPGAPVGADLPPRAGPARRAVSGRYARGTLRPALRLGQTLFLGAAHGRSGGRPAPGPAAARALAITFDDGYADNHDVARPILQRHGLPATFYIATGYLDGGRMFNDSLIEAVRRSPLAALDLAGLGLDAPAQLPLGDAAARRAAVAALLGALKYRPPDQRAGLVQAVAERSGAALPTDLMMRSDQVLAMHRAGMLIGAHTADHPILALLDEAAAREQIERSRQQLQGLLGGPVQHFAYPNGVYGRDYTEATARLVEAMGFDSAVATDWGAARATTDLYQLPRFTPWDQSPQRFAARMARNLLSS